MKKIKFTVLLFILISAFLLTACSAKPSEQSDATSDTTLNSQVQTTDSDEVSPAETLEDNTVSNTTAPSNSVFFEEYTPDENELEILPPNGISGDDDKNYTSDNNTESQIEMPTQKETEPEPTNPFAQGKPIELPFVPAQ
ncbi:MAG: hypothetical protein E7566_03190 [Ruminococcaceae bacterium]|nr:hypothetical protein [Oscillospiraceae bacterium]